MISRPDNGVASGGDAPRYFNREISWLRFNWRVLEEAQNAAHPLLERLRFLSISGSNLDEFFMVRVAGLRGQQLQGIEEQSIDGLTPAQQLDAIEKETSALMREQQVQWRALRALLAKANIQVLGKDDIDPKTSNILLQHFMDHVFPVRLFPIRV
jgi:polyphosphate kinase